MVEKTKNQPKDIKMKTTTKTVLAELFAFNGYNIHWKFFSKLLPNCYTTLSEAILDVRNIL